MEGNYWKISLTLLVLLDVSSCERKDSSRTVTCPFKMSEDSRSEQSVGRVPLPLNCEQRLPCPSFSVSGQWSEIHYGGPPPPCRLDFASCLVSLRTRADRPNSADGVGQNGAENGHGKHLEQFSLRIVFLVKGLGKGCSI